MLAFTTSNAPISLPFRPPMASQGIIAFCLGHRLAIPLAGLIPHSYHPHPAVTRPPASTKPHTLPSPHEYSPAHVNPSISAPTPTRNNACPPQSTPRPHHPPSPSRFRGTNSPLTAHTPAPATTATTPPTPNTHRHAPRSTSTPPSTGPTAHPTPLSSAKSVHVRAYSANET